MTIPPKYISAEVNDNFYICTSRNAMMTVFNSNAQQVDSAYNVYQLGTGRILFISPYNVWAWIKLVMEQQNNGGSHTYSNWEELTESRAWTIDSTGNKKTIGDTVLSVNKSHFWLKVKNGDKQGIYDLTRSNFIIPLTTDSIQTISNKYFETKGSSGCKVYDFDGKTFEIPSQACNLASIYDNGRYYETKPSTHPKGALYDSKGKLLFAEDKGWNIVSGEENKIIAFKVLNNNLKKPQKNMVDLYDNNGNFLQKVHSVEGCTANTLLVIVKDTELQGASKYYLYNVAKNNWLLIYATPPPSTQTPNKLISTAPGKVRRDNQFITIKYPQYTSFLNGYTGEQLFTISDSAWHNQVLGHITVNKNINNSWSEFRYNFAREKQNRPLVLRDPMLHIINEEYDSIASLPIQNNQFFLIKKKAKYGLLNNNLEETVQAVYDHLEFKNALYARATRKNRTFWIDTLNNILFGGINFSYVSDYSVNDKWLALTYKTPPETWNNRNEYKEVAQAHIIDKEGKILTTWDVSGQVNCAYMLTVNESILSYPAPYTKSNSPILLFNPKTNKADSLIYPFRDIKTFKNAALLIICMNNDKEQAAFSALDLSPVLPFSDYDVSTSMNVKEVNNTRPGMESGVMLDAMKKDYEADPESKITHHTRYFKLLGGFYSVSGIKFWDEASEK